MTENSKRQKIFRLSEDLIERFEKTFEELKEQGKYKFEQEFGEELLRIGLDGRRKTSEKSDSMRKISAKFPSKCIECGGNIRVSQTCFWARDVGVVCEECHSKAEVEGLSDPTLAKKFLKTRELLRTITALKSEANRLADECITFSQRINLYSLGERHEEIEKKKAEILRLVEDFLRHSLGSNQENEVIRKLSEYYEKLEEWQQEIRKEIEKRLLIPYVVKKKEEKQTYAT